MRLKIQKITSEHIIGEGAVKAFIYACVHDLKLGIGFHPDTSFNDYAGGRYHKDCFTPKESLALNESRDECFAQCEQLGLDIYGIAMEIIRPLLPKPKTNKYILVDKEDESGNDDGIIDTLVMTKGEAEYKNEDFIMRNSSRRWVVQTKEKADHLYHSKD